MFMLVPCSSALCAKMCTSGFNISDVPVNIVTFFNFDKSPSIGFTK